MPLSTLSTLRLYAIAAALGVLIVMLVAPLVIHGCRRIAKRGVIVSAQATAAQAKIQDEIADLQAKIETYKEYQTKYPLLKKIFAAMITDAENRIKILQALTGGAS